MECAETFLRPLNPRQISAFRAVMMTGGMTAASALLCISQPAVSRLVRSFEEDIGLTLFHRKGNLVVPTEEAKVVFREVARFFTASDHLRETATLLRNQRAHHLRIAGMPSLVQGFIPRVLRLFLDRYPDVSIVLHSDTSVAIADLVEKNQYDIGFAYVGSERPMIEVKPLPETEAVCIVHCDMDLAAREEVNASDLCKLPVIVLGPNSILHMEILSVLCAECPGFLPRIQVRYPWSACSMVGQGMGVAIVDPFTALEFADDKVVCRRFRPRIPYTFSTLFPPGGEATGLARIFADQFCECMRSEFRVGLSGDAADR
ncbi:LysR family transcriptional regulator [Shumkonia mesophila]|uniref:LysR family transcriptional regulator n=1 Tax=Shumkonia mesophila TaxID=2838854 RepID=UPI0029347FE2|nr:LysR family transcriptional regulator [Shumkonia mesophila]